MTPYQIRILLHYATAADDFVPLPGDSIYSATISDLIARGFLKRKVVPIGSNVAPDIHAPTVVYEKTAKLVCYTEALQAVPDPIWFCPIRPTDIVFGETIGGERHAFRAGVWSPP